MRIANAGEEAGMVVDQGGVGALLAQMQAHAASPRLGLADVPHLRWYTLALTPATAQVLAEHRLGPAGSQGGWCAIDRGHLDNLYDPPAWGCRTVQVTGSRLLHVLEPLPWTGGAVPWPPRLTTHLGQRSVR